MEWRLTNLGQEVLGKVFLKMKVQTELILMKCCLFAFISIVTLFSNKPLASGNPPGEPVFPASSALAPVFSEPGKTVVNITGAFGFFLSVIACVQRSRPGELYPQKWRKGRKGDGNVSTGPVFLT